MPTNEPSDIFKYYQILGDDECWPYIGHAWGGRARDPRPYFMANGRRQLAYRWVYELYYGVTLTPDQLILHSCDNGGYPIACGNVHHMRLGTKKDNSNDMIERQRHGLPKTVVRAIIALINQGRTHDDIAALYGIARTTVTGIAQRKTAQSRQIDSAINEAESATEAEEP